MISFNWQIPLTRNNQIFKLIANYVWTRLVFFGFGFVLFVWDFFLQGRKANSWNVHKWPPYIQTNI